MGVFTDLNSSLTGSTMAGEQRRFWAVAVPKSGSFYQLEFESDREYNDRWADGVLDSEPMSKR